MPSRKKSTSKKSRSVIALIVLLAGLGAAVIWFSNRNDQNTATRDDTSKTTSKVPSAQSDFSSKDTSKQDTTSQQASGGITDTNGTTTNTNSNPISTSNGQLSIYSPVKGALLKSGATVSGTSSMSKVSYRIVDDDIGMISTGTLNVVGGKFSGTIQFQTNASTGQIDMFGTQSDGNEFNNLSIPVRFN